MKITGAKRWLVLLVVSLITGTSVSTPFLRYNFQEQMIDIFVNAGIVDSASAYGFIGNLSFWFGIVVMVFYIIGGPIADKFGERKAITIGALIMGAASVWYALIPDAVPLYIIHVLYGVGTGFLWGAYIKLVRKLGEEHEQSRMFSSSEFIRGILGTVLGFAGVGILNAAVMGSGDSLATQFSILLFIHAALYIVLAIVLFILVPDKVVGLEVADDHEEVPFTAKSIVAVLKMPGVWLVALIIFFCFSFTSAGNGYIGSYTTAVLGISDTAASTYAIVRNYIIAALSTLAIGFVAAKVRSEVKTLGFYLVIATVLTVVMLLTQNMGGVCIGVTFVFAAVYTGMRGIYFSQLHEVNIPVDLTGVATGVISLVCYLPDVYFAKLAGYWVDTFGNAGYTYIWIYTIICGILGFVMVLITRRYIKRLAARKKDEEEKNIAA